MSQQVEGADSEDVNDFLVRIRELGNKRDKEDEERTKKLEDEILQGRRERQAKRAEHARSISPTKDSPFLSAHDAGLSSQDTSRSIEPPVDLATSEPQGSDRQVEDTSVKETKSPTKEPIEDSMAQNSTPSRASVAQSLGSKDPSWFRQTSDRGAASPAYRKTQSSATTPISGSPKLPGLSSGSTTTEPEKRGSLNDESERSSSPSRSGSIYGAGNLQNRYSNVSSVSTGLGSPVPLSSSRKMDSRTSPTDPDSETPERGGPMSPAQNRLTTERPSSPTKGLGGFVQSAMLKRSDSVNKRWSVQSGSGNRGSVALGSRNEGGITRLNQQTPGQPLESTAYEPSGAQSHPRPGSSQSEATTVAQSVENDSVGRNVGATDSRPGSQGGPGKPSYSSRPTSRSDSIPPGKKSTDLPTTPSKTMDAKRWSPTKSSWLESALNKPESPKPKPQTTPQQPEWKKELNRQRQSKSSISSLKPSELEGANATQTSSALGSGSSLPDPQKKTITDPDEGRNEAVPDSQDEPVKLAPGRNQPIPGSSEPRPSKPALKSSESAPSAVLGTEKDSSPVRSSVGSDMLNKRPASQDKAVTDAVASKPKLPSPPAKPLSGSPGRREDAPGPGTKTEPEFKNVLGKLRKAETKNYVAPDELKDNILRGKAALNKSGGPQKSQRVDEFKESLVSQRHAMKAGGGSIRRNSDEKKENQPPTTAVPEAIAKRNRMNRSESNLSSGGGGSPIKPTNVTDTPVSPIKADRNAPKAYPTNAPITSALENRSNALSEKTTSPERVLPERPREIGRQSPEKDSPSPNAESPVARAVNSQASKGGLAARLNPALAGILSRGPPTEEKESSTSTGSPTRPAKPTSTPEQPATLTHATKSRARGPKRRVPQSKKATSDSPAKEETAPTKDSSKPALSKLTLPKPEDSPPLADTPPPETPSERNGHNSILEAIRRRTPIEPPVTDEFPFNVTPGSAGAGDGAELLPATRYTAPESPIDDEPSSLVSSPKTVEKPTPPPKPSISRVASSGSSERELPRLFPKPQRATDVETDKPDSRKDNSRASSIDTSGKRAPPLPRKPSSSLNNSPESPPVAPKPLHLAAKSPVESKPLAQSPPIPQTSEASRVFSSFFDKAPKASDKVEVDPQSVLLSKAESAPKIKTLKKQIWEITGDGRKNDLPPNEEYILFEEGMYICVHTFETGDGSKSTQVHLWCGDGVSEAAVEDAQLFARKVSRENSCKLELLHQGKETSSFIQALGGIIITRRGSSSRASSAYMLCGRRHLGQISFNEVDLSPACLCSAYPYIISSSSGKLYLWQGKGSSADELGCARLISMDLGPTGEIEEVTEGEEPQRFFEAFPDSAGSAAYRSADYWRLKPNNSKYCDRLFRVDHNQGQRFSGGFWNRRRGTSSPTQGKGTVQEIEPFCQRDLEPSHIYILDAFFEIYVIVGEQAHSRSAEFATALVLAQEYSILAVSEQDRPFMPKSNVVLDGMPDECKRAFRKWDDRTNKAHRTPITIVPLDAAIEAIR